jgi:hypothetical protein
MTQYEFEQSIAGFDQLQTGDPFFHFRRFGRLRQLLHQGQFVGRIAPRRRLAGAFLRNMGIEQRPGIRRQECLARAGQAADMLIDSGHDERGQGKYPSTLACGRCMAVCGVLLLPNTQITPVASHVKQAA